MLTRRLFFLFAINFVAFSAYSTMANAQNSLKKSLLPWPADLAQAAAVAHARGQPLVLMVSLPGCPWCELLRRNYLGPMQSEGLPAHEFMINDSSRMLRDFNTQRVSPAALSSTLKISVTPTVLFIGRDGQEIAPRIEGVASADFIGAVLDERLATARERIKAAR